MAFSSDIKGAMRECLLQLFWPKKDIVSFFVDNGCSKKDISALGDLDALYRANIVDTMFKHLSSKKDEGIGQFRAMLQALVNWSHFDAYFFDKLKKLNRDDAKRAINHLRQLQEIRDHKLRDQKKQREKKERESQRSTKSLDELKVSYISLIQNALRPNERGYAFEKILQELCKISSLDVT